MVLCGLKCLKISFFLALRLFFYFHYTIYFSFFPLINLTFLLHFCKVVTKEKLERQDIFLSYLSSHYDSFHLYLVFKLVYLLYGKRLSFCNLPISINSFILFSLLNAFILSNEKSFLFIYSLYLSPFIK